MAFLAIERLEQSYHGFEVAVAASFVVLVAVAVGEEELFACLEEAVVR